MEKNDPQNFYNVDLILLSYYHRRILSGSFLTRSKLLLMFNINVKISSQSPDGGEEGKGRAVEGDSQPHDEAGDEARDSKDLTHAEHCPLHHPLPLHCRLTAVCIKYQELTVAAPYHHLPPPPTL